MKIFFDVRVARYLTIGLLVAAATFGFATSAHARVLLGSPGPAALRDGLVGYNDQMGDTREVWFIRGGFLYEVTTYQSLDTWLTAILQSWKFI